MTRWIPRSRSVRAPLVIIPAPTRLQSLRLARSRRIAPERVLNPRTAAEARMAADHARARGVQVEVILTEVMWDRPDADEMAEWIGTELNPHPAWHGAPSNLPHLAVNR